MPLTGGISTIVQELFASNADCQGLKRLVYGLGPIITYLRGLNVDVEPLLAAASLRMEDISSVSAFMSLEQELRFTKSFIESMNEPALGLKVGHLYPLSAYSSLGLATMTSETLQEGLSIVAEYNGLTWTRFRWSQNLDGCTAVLEARELERLETCHVYMVERDFCAVHRMCEEMIGTKIAWHALQLAHAEPSYASSYNDYFGCPVEFNAGRNALLFDSKLLEQPLPQSNRAMCNVSRAQCEELMGLLARENTYSEMIECLMVDGQGNFLSLEEVAAKLNISSRSLRRRLSKEGTSFQKLRTRTRCALAKDLLLSGKLTVDQVADRVGYCDAAAFCHAFKRWTGEPPGSYRL